MEPKKKLLQYIAQFAINEEEKRYFLLFYHNLSMSEQEKIEFEYFKKLNIPIYLNQKKYLNYITIK